MPPIQPASVLLRPQSCEKPGSRAAKLENPAMPKISAMHRAMMIPPVRRGRRSAAVAAPVIVSSYSAARAGGVSTMAGSVLLTTTGVDSSANGMPASASAASMRR
jgi:hypothetical protein